MLRPMSDYHFGNDLRVRFAETDAQGVAHHASYIVWFEVTRIEYLRRFRGGYAGLREEGVDA
jgi:acyl-CoA thioester hydrolase